jgi:hypothetical protein
MELARERFDLETAKATIAGYCFFEVDAESNPPPGETYGVTLGPRRRRRWGYLSYDCQRGPGPAPDIVDIIAPALLNVSQGYGVRLVSDLLGIAPLVREVVAGIDEGFCFWHLDPDDVAPRSVPREGTASSALHKAWYLVESVKGAGVAITHKLLHHAWPHLFPLIDNKTIDVLGRDHAWVTILEDLQREEESFDALEVWFEGIAGKRGELPLNRLRLYDILLWCRVVPRQEDEASREGLSFVDPS